MNIESSAGSAVVLRRRSGWEAAELGILLWQMNWKALFLFFGIPMTLCAVIVRLMPASVIQFAGLSMWWLLPLLDRFALQVVSVRFFDPHAPVKKIVKDLGRNLGRGLCGDLLWRRFSPFRSARMPITVLEKLKGSQLRKRKQLLGRNGLDFGFPLTLICLAMESILSFGELAFLFAMGKLFFPWYFTDIWTFTEQSTGILTAVTWINSTLVESLYVCMGFGLYINSRVETEGWDIEILFRKIAERKRRSPKAFVIPVLAILLTSLVCVLPASAETVQEEEIEKTAGISAELLSPEKTAASDAALLEEVLASPDFGQLKKGWKIQFKERNGENKTETFTLRNFPRLEELFGIIIRAAAVLIIAGALAASFYQLHKRGMLFAKSKKGIPVSSDGTLRKTGKTKEDPEALLETALTLHREGKVREGWALCFRAFLAALARLGISFPDEATEYEALALARRKNVTGAEKFASFINCWVSFAYGGRIPAEGSFNLSIRDCQTLLETASGFFGSEGTQ
jgi:hypothetical protein